MPIALRGKEFMVSLKKHKNKPQRKKDFDYSQPAAYFVTIFVKNRKCLFGDVENEKVLLNTAGKIAHDCLDEIPRHFENVELGEFVVMPNHIHGIVMIVKEDERDTPQSNENKVGDRHADHLREKRQYRKLSVIMGSYKSAVTKDIKRMDSNLKFRWQKSFHDRIIRNDREMEYISDYIRMNSVKWNEDGERNIFKQPFRNPAQQINKRVLRKGVKI